MSKEGSDTGWMAGPSGHLLQFLLSSHRPQARPTALFPSASSLLRVLELLPYEDGPQGRTQVPLAPQCGAGPEANAWACGEAGGGKQRAPGQRGGGVSGSAGLSGSSATLCLSLRALTCPLAAWGGGGLGLSFFSSCTPALPHPGFPGLSPAFSGPVCEVTGWGTGPIHKAGDFHRFPVTPHVSHSGLLGPLFPHLKLQVFLNKSHQASHEFTAIAFSKMFLP